MLKHFLGVHIALTIFLMVLVFVSLGFSQVDLAEQAYSIFEQSCVLCHGEHGAFREQITIDSAGGLIASGAVVPGRPIESELYTRLLLKDRAKRMPLGQPALSAEAILTISNWIRAGAPDWESLAEDVAFITRKEMLAAIEIHVNSLPSFDRRFARYFTLTHLYNAGETPEALHAYQRALSKLVNSLSWGRKVINPKPIDPEETIFYIDLRDYEWEIGTNRWTQIEQVYPYGIDFDAPTQTSLHKQLTNLREKLDCEVPFVDVDWFLATAALPPLYYDILDLPETDRALEIRLEVAVVENIRNAAGKRVWRAGFNDSRVSNNNRVVERHLSRYGAYWKSYDFAGSVGTQNIFRHPLSFEHDGGEIIFNLPNGLQAYYLADAKGKRLDAAPINIVSNPAASDPAVRTGLSCIGCHTQGMQTFTDEVRPVIKQNANPPYNKGRALQLYTETATMNALVSEDTDRYRQALEATGGVLGGIEPVQRFYEAFWRPLDVGSAAAAVGLETQDFLKRIRQNVFLKNLGLLVLENGTMKRDAWTAHFREVVSALDFPQKSAQTPVDPQTERIPGASVSIPDPNLRAAIAEALGKTPNVPITSEEMSTLKRLEAKVMEIQDLQGLQLATNLSRLDLFKNNISDVSPLAGLTKLEWLGLGVNNISDVSSLAGLTELWWLSLSSNNISDVLPLAGLTKLRILWLLYNNISDLSPLSGLTELRDLSIRGHENNISDLSPLAGLTKLEELDLDGNNISDLSPLAELTKLGKLHLDDNNISDVSPLAGLTQLRTLYIGSNNISDVSPLSGLTQLEWLLLNGNNISDVSPLAGLTQLESLQLNDTNISDVSLLAGLTELRYLILGGNNISDVSPLSGLTQLRILALNGNNISDVSPLAGLTQLEKLWLSGNNISDVSPLAGLTQLSELWLTVNDTALEVIHQKTGVEYTVSAPEIYVGDTFTLDISVRNVFDLAGWQFDIAFDPTVLEAIEVNEGDLLKSDGKSTFFRKGKIDNKSGKITGLSSARLSKESVSGTGTLLSITFSTKTDSETPVSLKKVQLGSGTGTAITASPHEVIISIQALLAKGDVNADGRVSILDIILIAQHFGENAPSNSAVDVNGDGVVSILDLIVVAEHLGESTAAASPSIKASKLTPAMIQAWIEQAEDEKDGSIAFQEGIRNLQRLLASLIPEKTALLANYPNPFNPETWIPYELSEPADVVLTIYAIDGQLVRTLALGHQPAGVYQSRSRAVYWDGRNEVGEPVASGIYFYTITAGGFTATRRMLIRK